MNTCTYTYIGEVRSVVLAPVVTYLLNKGSCVQDSNIELALARGWHCVVFFSDSLPGKFGILAMIIVGVVEYTGIIC